MQHLRKYIEYIKNTGGKPLKTHFDDDWEPIGPMVRHDLIAAGLASEVADYIELTDEGRKFLASH